MARHVLRVHPTGETTPRAAQLAWKLAEIAADDSPVDEAAAAMAVNRIVDNAAVSLAALARRPAANARAQAVARVGASVYDPEDARRLMAHAALDAIQFPFNLFDRRMSESGCTQRLVETGCLCFARSALLQGRLKHKTALSTLDNPPVLQISLQLLC